MPRRDEDLARLEKKLDTLTKYLVETLTELRVLVTDTQAAAINATED